MSLKVCKFCFMVYPSQSFLTLYETTKLKPCANRKHLETTTSNPVNFL